MKKFKRRVLEDPDPELDLEEEEEEIDGDEGDDEDDEEDDEEEEYEDDEDTDGETEPDAPPWRQTRRPAFRRSRAFVDDGDDAEELSEDMAAAIRAGRYKPRRADPWTAHILYNALKDTGQL
jgi:hypothetical protein